jgi:hypothetical protein
MSVNWEASMYFAIYYQVDDEAFKRAAESWKSDIKALSEISDDKLFIMHEVKTETDFKDAWRDIYSTTKKKIGSTGIVQGRIFSHSSKGSDQDGLEFKSEKKGGNDGTLTKKEIALLDKLPWDSKTGHLILHGCNTGLVMERGWCPAQEFANRQGIRTTGQQGYAYFSKLWDQHEEIATEGAVYLWAYERRKNGILGDGTRMEGLVFSPPKKSATGTG